LKNKKPKLVLTVILLLFSGYLFYKNITFETIYVPEAESLHQKHIKKLPRNLSFAGEEVHFKNKEAYKHFYKELYYRTRPNAYTHQALRNAGRWFPVIEKILRQYKLPDDLKYLALAESNLTNVRSPMGAVGFWQFTRLSGEAVGLIINDEIDERLDPEKSTHAACKHFKKLYAIFGNWTSVVAAYNVGETALYRAFQRQNVDSYYDLKLNRETTNYLYRIIALKDLVEHPAKYKMTFIRFTMPATETIAIKEDIENVNAFAKSKNIDPASLRKLNPWILRNSLHLPENKQVLYIKVPKKR